MSCGRVNICIKPVGATDIRLPDIGCSMVRPGTIGVSSVMMVCRVGKQRYLRVAPEEAMWITVDKSIDYEIRSNTDWTIE